MGGEWAEERFGNLVQCVSDKCQVKEVSVENYISTENMVPNFGGITLASKVPLAGSVTKFSVGDTLFSNIRTYFKKVWQAQFDGYCSNDVLVFRSANDEVLAQDYLHQICRWERFTELSVRTSKGAKMPRGDKSAIADFKFLLPPINEQRAIAHILGTLDDKIELNRRRNQTLEAMARALFKDWFVDFGPVRAKMEGREPYLPADLWQLFPDRLDDEGKPEGWKKMAAEVVADIGIGKTPPRKENQWFSASKSDVRWVSIRDMGNSGVFLQRTSEFLTRKAVEKFNVRVVPDNTVILSFKLTVGRVAITDGEMVTNEAIAHLKVRSDSGLSSEYVYSYLREFDYGRLGSTSSIATAVNSKSIKALPVLVPANDLAGWFSGRVTPIFARIKHLQSESESLAQLRDTLLPKLISGELRITDAEKLLERLV